MLRVRPIHFTSRLDQWERLLTDLGMIRTVDDGSWKEYDAGSGRLALHAAEAGSAGDGTTAFGVEVGDLAEFARRTNEAGVEDGTSPAELTTADHGDTCRITGGDGFSFFADKAAHSTQSADADPALAVVEVWFTPDAAAAAQTLRNMGARLRPAPDDDETARIPRDTRLRDVIASWLVHSCPATLIDGQSPSFTLSDSSRYARALPVVAVRAAMARVNAVASPSIVQA